MPRLNPTLFVLIAVCLAATPPAAAEGSDAPQQETRDPARLDPELLIFTPHVVAGRFGTLFEPQGPLDPASEGARAEIPQHEGPAVICGMLVVPIDPEVDPAMRVAIPDTGTTFTMRTFQPSLCGPVE
jgi:hypothetical protein